MIVSGWNKTVLPCKVIAAATGYTIRGVQNIAPKLVEEGLAVDLGRVYAFHPESIGWLNERVRLKKKKREENKKKERERKLKALKRKQQEDLLRIDKILSSV